MPFRMHIITSVALALQYVILVILALLYNGLLLETGIHLAIKPKYGFCSHALLQLNNAYLLIGGSLKRCE